MFDYLQKFNSLSKDLRDRVSSPSVMAAVTELENKYKIDLAMTVMKVMIKGLAVKDLSIYFTSEAGLSPASAENLARELKEKVFGSVAGYLGLEAEIKAFDLDRDLDSLIKEAGLVLPSANLVSRFKNILAIYSRGVRSKIDTRNSLAKDVKVGGLNLSLAEIDRVLKICDGQKLKTTESIPAPVVVPIIPVKAPAPFPLPPEEYDLKRALASGIVKTVAKKPVTSLDLEHEITAPEKQLDLAAPEKQLDLPAATPVVPVAPTVPPVIPVKVPVPQPKPIVAPVPPLKPLAPKALAPVVSPIAKPIVTSALPSVPPKPAMAPLKPVVPVVPAAIKKEIIKAPKKPSFWSNIFKKETKAAIKPAASTVVKPVIKPVLKPAIPVKNIIPAAPVPVAERRQAPIPSSVRPQMHDVKPVPKVMGPIEELQFLDVINFRRLGKTPTETTTKIFAKIKLLEKEGYDKMVSGVQAWRQSPTNRLYLSLGQEAIVSGMLLKDSIAARQKSGRECLSMEEIEAIVSLNSKLVF